MELYAIVIPLISMYQNTANDFFTKSYNFETIMILSRHNKSVLLHILCNRMIRHFTLHYYIHDENESLDRHMFNNNCVYIYLRMLSYIDNYERIINYIKDVLKMEKH